MSGASGLVLASPFPEVGDGRSVDAVFERAVSAHLGRGQAGGAFTDVHDRASSPVWSTPQGNDDRTRLSDSRSAYGHRDWVPLRPVIVRLSERTQLLVIHVVLPDGRPLILDMPVIGLVVNTSVPLFADHS